MKISIGLITFNDEPFIKATLDSILKNDNNYPDTEIELIIVDNGSIDKTPLIIDALQQSIPEIKCIRLLESRATAHIRNLIIEEATGDFIMFLNGGSVWPSERIPKLLPLLKSNDVVFTDSTIHSFDGENINPDPLFSYKSNVVYAPVTNTLALADILNNDLTKYFFLVSNNSIIRTSTIKYLGGFSETAPYISDILFILQLADFSIPVGYSEDNVVLTCSYIQKIFPSMMETAISSFYFEFYDQYHELSGADIENASLSYYSTANFYKKQGLYYDYIRMLTKSVSYNPKHKHLAVDEIYRLLNDQNTDENMKTKLRSLKDELASIGNQ